MTQDINTTEAMTRRTMKLRGGLEKQEERIWMKRQGARCGLYFRGKVLSPRETT